MYLDEEQKVKVQQNAVPDFKLTEWENEPTLHDLKQDFSDAKPERDAHVVEVEGWLENLNVTGNAKPKTKKNRSSIQPMLIRKHAEWRYAALSEPFLSTPDVFNVYPANQGSTKAAWQNELVLNHQFNHQLNKVGFIDEFVRTAVDEGTVYVRVGWDFSEEVENIEYPIYDMVPADQEGLAALQKAAQKPDEAPQEWQEALTISQQSGSPVMPVQSDVQVVEEVKTVRNQPTLEVCDYRNLTIDPSCQGNLDKAGFVIYSFETNRSELEKAGVYQNLDKIIVGDSDAYSDTDHSKSDVSAFQFKDKPRQKLIAYEYWGYWDIHNTGKVEPIVCTWVGNQIIRLEENPFPDKKIPFVSAQYLPVRKSAYGQPDGYLLEDNQKIVGATVRGMIDLMGKSANGQIGFRKDALDLTNKRKYMEGDDYEFNQSVDPRTGIIQHTYPEIPNSAGLMLNLQNGEASEMTGVRAFGATTSDNVADTATAQRGALDAASKRELGILRRLSGCIKEIGERIISMNSYFLEDEEIIRITNDRFVHIKRDDLAGEFQLQLTISTAEEDNAKAQELSFMLQTMGNNMDASMSRMILADIARLRKMHDLALKIEEFVPQPDPMQQMEMQQMQLEMQKTQAEIAKLQAEIQGMGGKVQLDLAKAQNLNSDTDLKNLEYVENQTGVEHARDMQKMGAQAEANAKHEMVKALVNQVATASAPGQETEQSTSDSDANEKQAANDWLKSKLMGFSPKQLNKVAKELGSTDLTLEELLEVFSKLDEEQLEAVMQFVMSIGAK